MNNEIKEILEFKENADYKRLSVDEIAILEDYITNLQKENMKLISENEAIKNIKYTVDETIYKSRINKAIKYINEHIKYECDNTFNGMSFYSHHLYDFKKEDLLNILQGSDDNE